MNQYIDMCIDILILVYHLYNIFSVLITKGLDNLPKINKRLMEAPSISLQHIPGPFPLVS
jgi:hypothetical protein